MRRVPVRGPSRGLRGDRVGRPVAARVPVRRTRSGAHSDEPRRRGSNGRWRPDEPGLLADRRLERLVLAPPRLVDQPHRPVREQPGAGRAGRASQALGARRGLASLRAADLGQPDRQQAPGPRLEDAGTEAPELGGGPLRGGDPPLRRGACRDTVRRPVRVPRGRLRLVDSRLPRLGERRDRCAPRIALGVERGAGGRVERGRALGRGEAGGGPGEASQPRRAGPLGGVLGRVDVRGAGGRVPGQHRRDALGQRARGREHRVRLQPRPGGRELPAGVGDLAGGQREQSPQERRRDTVLAERVAGEAHRLTHDAGAEDPRPVARRARRPGLEPCPERLALAMADERDRRRPEAALGPAERVERVRPAAFRPRPPGGRQLEPRLVADDRRRQALEPGRRGIGQSRALSAQQPANRGPVLGSAVRAQRLRGRLGLLEQRPGPGVAVAGRLLPHPVDEHPVEERPEDLVVAVRLVGLVELDREDLAPVQLAEERRAAAPAEQLVAERPRQPAQHARLDEELAELLGQVGQDVPRQVLADEPAAGPDRGEDPAPLVRGLAARREVEELEAGRPALGPAGEDGQLVGRDGLAVVVPEQALHLPRPEPQVVRADLDEVAGDAQSAQVDRRREPRPEDDREPARGVLDEPAERDLRGRPLEAVGVVDDEERAFGGARLEGPCRVLDRDPATGHARQRRPQRRLEVADHRGLVGVPRFGPVPRDGDAGTRGELGEERRLAGARRRDHDAEAAGPDRVEEELQPLARQRGRRRHADLGRDHGRRRI